MCLSGVIIMENIIMDEKVLDEGKTNTCNQTEPNVTEVETVQKCDLFWFQSL